MTTELEKKTMRKAYLKERRGLSSELIETKSACIFEKFVASPQYMNSKIMMCYAAMKDEVQTYSIIEHALTANKIVCIPYICDTAVGRMDAVVVSDLENLVKGEFGILTVRENNMQIVNPSQIDLIALPGVAFGRNGQRLGMGAGFYDRFLVRSSNAISVGLAFSCQLSKAIPFMPYDYFVDYVMTEDEIINCKTGKM